MKTLHRNFMEALRAAVSDETIRISKFITERTFLEGKKFSYKDHEFQEYIVDLIENNPGKTFSISKSSQIGLSEIVFRVALAKMAVKAGETVILSMPSISFAIENFKTRVAPIIDDSPFLDSMVDKRVDSASVKRFLNNSIIYALGGSNRGSSTTLLNRRISAIISDELDKQSPEIVSGYRSRMTHVPEKERLIINISTPTLADIGIDAAVKAARELHTPWVQCQCGHEFIADYYKDIAIPGYDESLLLLTKEKAANLDLDLAYLKCPSCGGEVNKDNKKTVWKITYNEKGGKGEIGVKLDVFVAMGFITIPDLVRSSLIYTSHVEFLNQGLGKVAAKSDSTIDKSHIHFLVGGSQAGAQIFGLDMGKMCTYLRGVLRADTTLHVVEANIVKLSELEDFLKEENSKHVFTAGVVDSQPYSDLVYRLIRKYPRLFSAIYVSPNPPKPEMYSLKLVDKYDEVVRQVTINKNLAMDTWVGDLDHLWSWEPTPLDAIIIQHLLDMRRGRDYRFEEMMYKWVKSEKGQDHFFHAGVYLYIAAKLSVAGVNNTFAPPIVIGKMNPEARRNKRGGRRSGWQNL